MYIYILSLSRKTFTRPNIDSKMFTGAWVAFFPWFFSSSSRISKNFSEDLCCVFVVYVRKLPTQLLSNSSIHTLI